jgi:hypothetical protein
VGDQITAGLGQAWAVLVTFVPKLLGFLLILFIGWLIAKAVSKAVGFLLQRIGFGKLVEKSGMNRVLANSPIDAGGLIVKLVYYFILLIALQFAFGAFGSGNAVSVLINDVIAYLPKVIVAIVLVLVAAAIAGVVRDLVVGALGRRSFAPLLGTISYVFLLALGVIAALNQLGIATTVTLPVLITALATVGGILVVGVGGGLIKPMSQRWDGMLRKLSDEETGTQPAAREGNSYGRVPASPADLPHHSPN